MRLSNFAWSDIVKHVDENAPATIKVRGTDQTTVKIAVAGLPKALDAKTVSQHIRKHALATKTTSSPDGIPVSSSGNVSIPFLCKLLESTYAPDDVVPATVAQRGANVPVESNGAK